ncbi:Por secretion system C-terminal sorting domain-containing protein [Mesonia phycicola]|uniref:Por secretion system C-terminal sorting domain-containing protein n=1 Tax=Mesonia phycicola TaxID=579105 RepID=A0A1M6FIP9_9FLAO|nr:fibronectin type III domain-containing protein [Mesonia phycicola]SHI97628.1 Por secretion system C-terminal sorting domain-containing protein [Mesonia phycicola]
MNKITFLVFILISSISISQVLDEDFEGTMGANGLPTGWTETGLSTDGIWSVGDATSASSLFFSYSAHTNFAYTNDDDCNCDKSADRLITPALDLSTLTTVELTYSLYFPNSETVTIEVSTDSGVTWTTESTLTSNSGWLNNETLDLTTYAGQSNVLISFLYNDNGDWAYGLGIDDVMVDELPTCVSPSSLSATNVSATGADLSWTENGTATSWNIEVVTAGTSPTGVATTTGVTNPYTVSGLSSATDYEFYVQSDCGNGDLSSWSGPFSFTTPCAIFTTPFLEDFNGTTSVPNCWEEAGSGTPTTGPSSLGSGNWNFGDYLNDSSNTISAKINLWYTGKEEWLISPEIDITSGSFNLEYKVAETDYDDSVANEDGGMATTDDEVQVLITTDGGATWQNITTYNASNVAALAGQQESFSLAAYTGTIQIAFWASEGTVDDTADYDFFIEDVAIVAAPTCDDPTNIVVSNITETTAEINWTENGSATEWEILYGVTGFDPTTAGTLVMDNDGTLGETLSGLTEGQDYDVYVRSVCSSLNSGWVGPVMFTTLCPEVTSISVTNITGTTAEINWTENGSATEWEILYGVTGFDPTTAGTLVMDNDGTLGETLSGLTYEEDYDVYVRSICSSVDSDWTGPEMFTTGTLNVSSEILSDVKLYPNPTRNILNFTADIKVEKISIYSILGNKVFTLNPKDLNVSMNLESLQSGVYLVKVQKENAVKTFKIIKE